MKEYFQILYLLILSSAFAQITPERDFSKNIKEATQYVEDLKIKLGLPGISVCVATKEKIIWQAAIGFSDIENKVPLTSDSKFRIGSLSKCLTSLAIGKLFEQGKLNLDTPIQVYVPYFPVKQYVITSRMLAGHTAGIRHYYLTDSILLCPRKYSSIKKSLEIFKNDSLLFKPNTKYFYSSFGYNLLGAVIEGAAKSDYLPYMDTAVLKPLGMLNTLPDYSDSIIANRVRFYEKTSRGLINAPMVDNSYRYPSGGFLSTPSELVKIAQNLFNYTFLKRETVELLLTSQHLENGDTTTVGICWRIGTDSKGRYIIHHGGNIQGGRAFLLFYPKDNIFISICTNMTDANINIKEASAIADLFIK